MTVKTPPAIIFDLDGTLIDAFADIAAALNHGLSAHGLPTHSVEAVHAMVGNGVERLIDRAAPGHPEALKQAVMETLLHHYRLHPADYAFVFEGMLPVLEDLRGAGCPLGILSNKPHDVTLLTCERLGLTPLFDDIVGEHPVRSPRKPDPTALRAQLERLGATKALLVGDGVPDGVVAERAGIDFGGCLWGTRNREELEPHRPVFIAESPAHLRKLLHEYLRRCAEGQ